MSILKIEYAYKLYFRMSLFEGKFELLLTHDECMRTPLEKHGQWYGRNKVGKRLQKAFDGMVRILNDNIDA